MVQQLQWLQTQKEKTAVDGHALQNSLEELLIPGGAHDQLQTGQRSTSAHQDAPRALVGIHTGVGNWQDLASNLPANSELLLLDQHSSGLQQIGELLQQQGNSTDYKALVLVLPPSLEGSIQLGSDMLSLENLQDWSQRVSQWSAGLAPEAHLSVWLSGSTENVSPLVETLASLTNTQGQVLKAAASPE